MNTLRAILIFTVLVLCLFVPVHAVDTSYVYSFDIQIVPNATITILKQDGSIFREPWTTDELGSYDLDQIKSYLQVRWSSLPNGYVFYIQVQKYPFDRTWKLQRIDATHVKVNDGNTYTTSTVWTYLKNNLRLTEPAGLGHASRTGVTVSSTDLGVRVDGSGDSARIFIDGDIHYRYTVQHVNDSENVTDEFVVYPQLIDSDYYVVFDADQWSYYTVDGTLIEVGITDMRLVGDTVQITGDGYDRLALPADYANLKLRYWNQKSPIKNNPWTTASGYENDYVGSTSKLSGTSVIIHTADYTSTVIGHYWRCSWTQSTANNYYQFQFYVDSDHNAAQDVVIETLTPDHIDYFIVEFYNLTAGAYQEVLNDSTYTAANLIHLNNSSTGLDFAFYESGQRGDTVSAIYGNTSKPDQTVSAYYGCINRTLMLFTLPADDGADSATSGASQVKLRLTVYYVDPGYATYEFEDSNNNYYGLDCIDGDTFMLYKAGTQNITYLTYDNLTYSITGMTVRADENELIDYLNITFNQTPTNLTGLIINQTAIDVDTDSDGDNVPDAFEDANITVNKGQQGGELKWDYVWEGAYNIVNSTGYIYYTNLDDGSALVGTELQTASITSTANISVNTAGAGEIYNFTVNAGTVDWLNVTSGLAVGNNYRLKNSTGLIETQTADASGTVNFTTNLITGTYYIESIEPIITLLSQIPSILYKNSTGYLNISYGISHNSSGLNNTSVSFIYRNYDWDLSDSNHSIRPPANDLASEWNIDGKILRAANRNETVGRLNFEDNDTITGGDDYTWSGLDENHTRLTIIPVNNTYTIVNISGTVHDLMPQMWYLDRTDQQQATKTQLPIHKTQNVLIKFWNFEIFKGNYDFLGVGYTDTSLSSNPALWPSDANPVNFYYVNSSYDPATGGDPITSGYAVYMGSLNASGWTDHVYSPHSNSNYVRGFIDNNYLHTVINTTNISYLYFTSNTESSRPFYINMTNVVSSTNISFADTNMLWAGNTPPYTPQLYTPNVWFAFMKLNMSLDHKLYAADNNNLWSSSSMSRTNITQALFPPTTPTINHFHFLGETDYDMGGVYYGNFSIGCGVSSDPDGGTVTHNLTLHYANNLSLVFIINNTFTDLDITHNGIYFDANFSSIPYYSDTLQYTLKIVAVDDEGYTSESWLGRNFTLTPTVNISGYITNILELPIENARIDINSNYVFTNSSGYYEIFEIIPGLNNITIRAIGYSNKYDRINMINTSISNYTLKERRSPSKAPCFGFILSLIIILTVAFITRKPKQF